MKKLTIAFLAVLFCFSTKAQYSDGKTSVTITGVNTVTIKNLQSCSTTYKIRLPDLTFMTTSSVAPNSSLNVSFETCGGIQVFTNTNCSGSEPLPVGIEARTCFVLDDGKVERKISLKSGYIEVMLKFATPPAYKYYFFSLKMSDGTVRNERIALDKKEGDWYYGTVKL